MELGRVIHGYLRNEFVGRMRTLVDGYIRTARDFILAIFLEWIFEITNNKIL